MNTTSMNKKGATDVVVEGAIETYRWVRDYCTAVKNGHYQPFSALERKVREATRNEPWGPTGTMLNELAEASHNEESCYVIFAVVDMRLGYPSEKWRNVYKALTVLEFILKRGSELWVTLAKGELERKLLLLEEFEFFDEKGHDQGVNVRHRSAAIRALIQSPRLLAAEREAAEKKRKQYAGYSRDDLDAGQGRPANNDGFDYRSSSSAFSTTLGAHGGSGSPPGFARFSNDGGRDDRSANQPRSAAPGTDAAAASRAAASRNAGEMKGVTLEDNKKNLAALKAIMARPENRTCADCAGASSSRPTWASINTGAFICMQCAGIHRGLGVHISKVRSCTLDTWLPGQVSFMAATGNAIANSYWEALLPPNERPVSGARSSLSTFIRLKYTGHWAEGTWPPELAAEQPPSVPVMPTEIQCSTPQPQAAPGRRFSSDAFPTPSSNTATTATPTPGSFWASFPEPQPVDSAPALTPQAMHAPPPTANVGGTFWSSFQGSPAATATPPAPPTAPQVQVAAPPPATGIGSFWNSFQDPSPAPLPAVPLPAASRPVPQQEIAPPPPPVMFDLLTFDDEPPSTRRPPPGAVPTAVPAVPATANGFDLLNLSDSPPVRAANAVSTNPVSRAAFLSSTRISAPAEPVYFDRKPASQYQPAPAVSDMQLLEELNFNPNLMDHAELYGAKASLPRASANLDPHGSGTFSEYPDSQNTGKESVVPGLDDLLSYQYTGVDYQSNRLEELPPARRGSSTRQPAYGTTTASTPAVTRHSMPPTVGGAAPAASTPQKHLQAESNLSRAGLPAASGRATWQHPGGQGRAAGAGLSVFDTLQEEILSTYQIASPGAKLKSNSNAQPMRAPTH